MSEPDHESELACCCDLVNTWCRESGVEECRDPYRNRNLRETVDRLWSHLSSKQSRFPVLNARITTLQAERDALYVACKAAADSIRAYQADDAQVVYANAVKVADKLTAALALCEKE